MEIFQVLFIAAVLAAVLSFVVAKLANTNVVGGDDDHSGQTQSKSTTTSEMDKGIDVVGKKFLKGKSKGKSSVRERRVEIVDFSVVQGEEDEVEKLETQNEKIKGKVQARGAKEIERQSNPQIEDGVEGNGESDARTEETKEEGYKYNYEHEEDWDWEGIEKSELEKIFEAAVKFVGSGDNISNVGIDDQKKLSALHKVATEGPCWEPQPMVLKFFSRAKWDAWQRLGNMTPDMAMEQYIALLSHIVPKWMEETFIGGIKSGLLMEKKTSNLDLSLSMCTCSQPKTILERQIEIDPKTKAIDLVQTMKLQAEVSTMI